MTAEVNFPTPDDWHLHLRDGEMMQNVMPFADRQFAQFLVMPNLTPAVQSGNAASEYRTRLHRATRLMGRGRMHMTIYLTPATTATTIYAAHAAGVIAAKYYPHGGTTNSGSGLSSPRDVQGGALLAMEDCGMVLCLHGEVTPDAQPDSLEREADFIPYLKWLVETFSDLKIVVEHVSDRRMVYAVDDMPSTVSMSVTGHHPFLTNLDAIRDPHCNCMPVAKTTIDRDFLAGRILEAHKHPKVFYGGDSAPHPVARKKDGAAGVFSQPVVLPRLWSHFDTFGGTSKWDAFEAFTSVNGARFYGRELTPQQRGTMTLIRERWQVPNITTFGVVPWLAGEVLDWRVGTMLWFGEIYQD